MTSKSQWLNTIKVFLLIVYVHWGHQAASAPDRFPGSRLAKGPVLPQSPQQSEGDVEDCTASLKTSAWKRHFSPAHISLAKASHTVTPYFKLGRYKLIVAWKEEREKYLGSSTNDCTRQYVKLLIHVSILTTP